jgi:hypothetical protein
MGQATGDGEGGHGRHPEDRDGGRLPALSATAPAATRSQPALCLADAEDLRAAGGASPLGRRTPVLERHLLGSLDLLLRTALEAIGLHRVTSSIRIGRTYTRIHPPCQVLGHTGLSPFVPSHGTGRRLPSSRSPRPGAKPAPGPCEAAVTRAGGWDMRHIAEDSASGFAGLHKRVPTQARRGGGGPYRTRPPEIRLLARHVCFGPTQSDSLLGLALSAARRADPTFDRRQMP